MKVKKSLLVMFIISLFICFSSMTIIAKGFSAHSSAHSSVHSSVSRSTGSGVKSGSFSNASRSTSSIKSGSFSTRTVNVNSKALKDIPATFSSHSISNNYYYHSYSGWSNFWSNYWLYRAITPVNRTYVSNGVSTVAPAYTGLASAIPDIITWLIIIGIICLIIYLKRKKY